MARIQVSNLTFRYEGSYDPVFEDVSFSIDTDWKLGFIGRNGKGKTTFLQLLMGRYAYTGSIDTATVFDYFPYPIAGERMERCAAEWIGEIKSHAEEWRVILELGLMGESAEILYRRFATLSPGERTKVLLAVLFSGENEFLLIDEPTNHLDRESREIVKKYLASKRGFILVSHDRDLLDACIDHCLVLNRRTIEVQKGNFSSWWENKQKRDQFAVAENEKHMKEIRKLKQAVRRTSEWADKSERGKIGFNPIQEHDRFKGTRAYIGSKTKKMQSQVRQMKTRIDREIEEKEGLLQDLEETRELKLEALVHPKRTLVSLRDCTVSYLDGDTPVFTDLTLTLQQGERVALSGRNGCGKSTLIRLILQRAGMEDEQLQLVKSGVCETASGLAISYVGQDTSWLRGKTEDFCRGRRIDLSLFYTVLRQLDFERVQLTKNMEDYSEGQKKKVLIAASILTPAHLYVWDEPLNYIDVFSRMQIENLLLSYSPTMLFVEHDVRFREKIATRVIEM